MEKAKAKTKAKRKGGAEKLRARKKQALRADAAACVKITDMFSTGAGPSSAPVADIGGEEDDERERDQREWGEGGELAVASPEEESVSENTTERMCWTIVHLLFLTTLSCMSGSKDKTKFTVSCPEYQRAFGGSCYEFVDHQHTFLSAQAWCEQRGGHLGLIPDKETQYFLQGLLNPKKDVWVGMAPSPSTNLQYSPTVEGALSWLDGSHISYSNWAINPQPEAGCGHILRDSGFQWQATGDCNKKLPFICEFGMYSDSHMLNNSMINYHFAFVFLLDSGRSIVCGGRNTTLQCGSGQVLIIDGSFYGRGNVHYCRSPLTTSTKHQCGWVDVVESIKARCNNRKVCHLIANVVDLFGEPCPQLGSYLPPVWTQSQFMFMQHLKSQKPVYQPKPQLLLPGRLRLSCPPTHPPMRLRPPGLTLSVSTVAAVFEDVNVKVKLESTKVHKYTYTGTFVVEVECTSKGIHITAQSVITIQEPITVFGFVRCYAEKQSFHATNCKALYGEPFQIQMELKAGTNVTYRMQSDKMLLSHSFVVRGNVPENITVSPEIIQQHGLGCHRLTLYASNMVTSSEVSMDMQMCVLEKITGLQASVLTEDEHCLDSKDVTVAVTLEQGTPVLLRFYVTGDYSSYSETKILNTGSDIFHIGPSIQDPDDQNPEATTAGNGDGATNPAGPASTSPATISQSSTIPNNPNNPTTIGPASTSPGTISHSSTTPNNPTTVGSASTSPATIGQSSTIPNNPTTVGPASTSSGTISQSSTIPNNPATVGPASTSPSTLSGTTITPYNPTTLTNPITNDPASTTSSFQYQPYHPTSPTTPYTNGPATTLPGTMGDNTATLTTANPSDTSPSATNDNNNLKCITSPESGTILDAFNITCTTEIPCSNCQYCFKTQDGKHLLCSNTNEVMSVFLPLGNSSCNFTLIIKATAKNSSYEANTTITAEVLDYTENDTSSVDGLKVAVDKAVALLKKQGLLSGQNVGQIFSSVSNKLNSQSDEANKANRQKLREEMMAIITDTVKEVPTQTPEGIQVIARGLAALVQRGTELSSSAQMLSIDNNPFAWHEGGNISGVTAALSLTTTNGSSIAVENLSENIKILLPRPVGEQVNTSFLDLGNFSTTIIEVASADSTLVLKGKTIIHCVLNMIVVFWML
ncbi:hypothetical protein F7725_001752 [Dissostichus mawsoni]|uniref:C-type lectin domain-containing protein n=1 Tax=Dissostichus mawsoni TaxID=36200 RepID=A0A7J5Y1E7_DISMA|nr:hypothetical protein F7725_001752 [Dissostichus mawsoni]